MARKVVVRMPVELQKQLYRNLDESYLFKAAWGLAFCLDHREEYKREQDEVPDQKIFEIDDEWARSIRSYVHFLELQQTELLFALLTCPFSGIPHWQYLLEYRTSKLKALIDQFVKGNIRAVTRGALSSASEFIKHSVYSNFKDGRSEGEWESNITTVIECLERMGRKYVAGSEYNSFKHGVRLHVGGGALRVALDSEPEKIQTIFSFDDGVSFLELKDVGEGAPTVHATVKEFSFSESLNNLAISALILRNIKDTRLARIERRKAAKLHTFYELDVDALRKLASGQQYSVTV